MSRQRAAKSNASTGRKAVTRDNALAKLIRDRMSDLGMTYVDVAKAGGFPHHTTVAALVNKAEHKQTPRPETLRRLAKALQVPLDVVKVAAARAAGYEAVELTTTLSAADDTRVVVAYMGEMTDVDRRRITEMVTEIAELSRQEGSEHALKSDVRDA